MSYLDECFKFYSSLRIHVVLLKSLFSCHFCMYRGISPNISQILQSNTLKFYLCLFPDYVSWHALYGIKGI